jgi:hypothetical protein
MGRTGSPVTEAASDVAAAAVAVVSVSAAIARLMTDRALRASRTAIARREHVPVVRPTLARGLRGAADDVRAVAVRRLGHLADALLPPTAAAVLSRLDVPALVQRYVDVNRIAGLLDVDSVAARLDVGRVVDRVDIGAIAAALDLDSLVEKVDIARVLDRVDLDDIVARVDIARVIDRVDLDEIVARVDIARVIDRLDLDDIVARVDIARVIDRLDLDDIVARVDVDKIASRLDLDPVIERANILELARYVVQEIDLPAIIRSSSASLSTDVVRGVRDQGADADRAVERVVDRLLLRRRGRHDAIPVQGT